MRPINFISSDLKSVAKILKNKHRTIKTIMMIIRTTIIIN